MKQELINTWFMKPRKATTAMRIGSLNERNINEMLPRFFEKSKSVSKTICLPMFYILTLFVDDTLWSIDANTTTGLISRRDRPDLADSPDGLLKLSLSTPAHDETRSFIAALEIKTAAALSTERQAQQRVENIPLDGRVISVEFDSDLFRKLVWTPSHRGQVCHLISHLVV